MLPPLVERALALSERAGFTRSCSAETGRLLQVLAGQRGRTRVAEIGAGCGVGSAWILSALDPGIPFVTVELDAERAPQWPSCSPGTRTRRCSTATGASVLPAEAPFDLLFADGGKAKADEEVLGLLAPGGTLFLDDLTPGYEGHDPVRSSGSTTRGSLAAELQVSPREAVIVGTLQPR